MRISRILLAAAPAAVALATLTAHADLDPKVQEAEAKRVAVIEKIKPSVVAVFAHGGQGGGSGVVITADGYALTNYHVVEGPGPVMQCGLSDGVLYDAVLVGQDKVGDVALIKLLPKKEGQAFPFAPLGDSDKLKAGDWSFAMGNPFLLATDFTPTVTYGLISGVHRYQYPAGTLLEYTDCIQIDTSINPGNSGGPLFNADGELVGINGRGSFEKRGRVNSGVGYAISINQIKNFMGHLRAGLDADHATLGARVETRTEDAAGGQIVIGSILEDSDGRRRGLEPDDELVSFTGQPITSVNKFKNVLGLYPKGWRVPLVYRRAESKKEILVRLMGVQQQELIDPNRPKPSEPPGGPRQPKRPAPNSPATKLYEAKAGFANFYFNKQERDRMLVTFRKHGDFATFKDNNWTLDLDGEIKLRKVSAQSVIGEDKDSEGNRRPFIRLTLGAVKYDLDPLKRQDVKNLKEPIGSGGLMVALYQYRLLLTVGEKAFEGGFSHGGHEPLYLPPADEKKPEYLKNRVETEVLRTEHAGIPGKWFFALKDDPQRNIKAGALLGFELTVEEGEDPCEVYLFDYKPMDGRLLPQRLDVRHGNDRFGTFAVKGYQLAAGK